MKQNLKRWAALITGWIFLVLGVAGLFLPVLQGVLFIVIGLLILSSEYVWAHHLLEKARSKFPHIASHVDQAKRTLGIAHPSHPLQGSTIPGASAEKATEERTQKSSQSASDQLTHR